MAPRFQSADELRRIAGAIAAKLLPLEIAQTLPVLVRHGPGFAVIVLFYPETGRPNRRTVSPPTHAMLLDAASGGLIRFWQTSAEELGIVQPCVPVAGAGIPPGMSTDEFIRMRDRFLAISADVWTMFAYPGPPDPTGRELVAEFRLLFLKITKSEVAPFYVGAAAEFFAWVFASAAP